MLSDVDPQLLTTLVKRCQEGDAEAFDAIFNIYRGPLYSYLARTTGDRHLAEDLMQDTFVRMVEHLDRYEESGKFTAWLFRIAANRVRDWARRRQHGERVGGLTTADDPDAAATVDRPVEHPPDADLLRGEQVRRLERCVHDLAEEDRQVILLRHYSGLSFREIAGIVDAPLGTVLARSHRALAKLRERMGGESE